MQCVGDIKFQLIVTVINKGFASDVIDASRAAGAEGGTIIPARGSGIHETSKFFGVVIEPEKEIVLTLVDCKITEVVMESIAKAIDIDKPGTGISFVVDVPKVYGISHLLKKEEH